MLQSSAGFVNTLTHRSRSHGDDWVASASVDAFVNCGRQTRLLLLQQKQNFLLAFGLYFETISDPGELIIARLARMSLAGSIVNKGAEGRVRILKLNEIG